MRIMGVDYGDSRIGVAMSDPFGWTAQGVETIQWQGNMEKPAQRLVQLVKQHGVEKIIIGYPRNMDGTVGFRGEKTDVFIEVLKKNLPAMEIQRWDERLTTVAAHRSMNEMGVKASKKKGLVDQIAAVYILQGYLDSLK